MRLHLRRRVVQPNGARLPSDGSVARQSPPSALTSWLRQGLRTDMCPLCRVAHKADRQYIWHFYDEHSNDMDAVAEVQRAFGFCAEHIEMLRRIDVDEMKTTLSISALFADTFAGIVDRLDALTPGSDFESSRCPGCANRDDLVARDAGYLLDMLATGPGYRDEFVASPGLCFPHFKLVWGLARTRDDRELLLTVQRNASRSLLGELREHVRKHDDKYRHEPKGAERDSWQRAIFLTAGWPPPGESAARPEGRR
jgi:Family of unknown function (DUF6062)